MTDQEVTTFTWMTSMGRVLPLIADSVISAINLYNTALKYVESEFLTMLIGLSNTVPALN